MRRNRVMKEYADLQTLPFSPECTIKMDELDVCEWTVNFLFSDVFGSDLLFPFSFILTFGPTYPFDPPFVTCPKFGFSGRIYVHIDQDEWSPAGGPRSILAMLQENITKYLLTGTCNMLDCKASNVQKSTAPQI